MAVEVRAFVQVAAAVACIRLTALIRIRVRVVVAAGLAEKVVQLAAEKAAHGYEKHRLIVWGADLTKWKRLTSESATGVMVGAS